MANLQLTRNLLNYRESHNYTQEKVSRYLNISRQAYSNYETGKRSPNVDLLVKLTELYSITLDQLVMKSCNKNNSNANLVLHENRSYYQPAATKENDTLFLSKKEADIVLNYRESDACDCKLIDKILNIR